MYDRVLEKDPAMQTAAVSSSDGRVQLGAGEREQDGRLRSHRVWYEQPKWDLSQSWFGCMTLVNALYVL